MNEPECFKILEKMRMKIKPEHYEHMREAMRPLADKIPAHREQVRQSGKFKDLEMRVRWDWFLAAGLPLFASDTLYKLGLTDNHIDTALRAIVKELGLDNTKP